jgi:putative flavoprotein involved in K+ transport
LDLPIEDESGWPREDRGIVPEVPGLFFAGLIFQYAFTSMLVGGAARDARHVATAVLNRQSDSARDAAAALAQSQTAP